MKIKKNNNIHQDFILQSVINFYKCENHINLLLQYINGYKNKVNKITISLRFIDWFIISYCKKYNISLKLNQNSNIINFNIYSSYKQQLTLYSKELFDTFRRNNKINFTIQVNNESKILNTTLGQLNFFKWLIENNILNYIINNYKTINNIHIKYNEEKDKALQLKKLNKTNKIAQKKSINNDKIILRKGNNTVIFK